MKKLFAITVALVLALSMTSPSLAGEKEATKLLAKICFTPPLPSYTPEQDVRLRKAMARILIREWAWSRAHSFNFSIQPPESIEKEILAEAVSELYRYLPSFMKQTRVRSTNPGLQVLDEMYFEGGGVSY